jgi:phosphonate transport system substrate-binding protein
MKLGRILLLMLILVISISIVGAQDDLGSEANPIQVYFVPSVEAQALITGGDVLAEALTAATGLHFEVSVPTSYAAALEAICADPSRSMGFIPALGYVVGNNRCGIEVHAAAVRFGWPVYWAQYIVRRDSDIFTFADLDGRTWAYGDPGSTSGFLFPTVEMSDAGITPGTTVETGGHGQTVTAVYSGEADFGTTFFSPPRTPGAAWDFGDLPEPFDLTVEDSYTTVSDSGSTRLWVGDIRVMDARAQIAEQAPDVVDQVRILRISSPIPNDTMSFGADVPVELRDDILNAIIAFAETDDWELSALGSSDGYDWTTMAPIADSNYDIIRAQMDILGLSEDDIFGG